MASYSTAGSESKLILLIEDNIDDERLTLRALRKNNIMNEVVIAGDGQQAVDYLFGSGNYAGRDMSVMPVVVILDLKLPKLSGLEVLKQIRSNPLTAHVPVVVLTSSDDVTHVDESYKLGANSFIQKPTDPSDFSEMVLQVAMYWLLLNRTTPERVLGR
jgi:two-component system response regulator